MEDTQTNFAWEAPQHRYIEKSSDWYWIVGILSTALVVVVVILGNVLLGVLIAVAAMALVLVGSKRPRLVIYHINNRGLSIEETFYSWGMLAGYRIDEEDTLGPNLLLRQKQTLSALLVIPLPPEYVDNVERIVSERLPFEELSEPLAQKILEIFGF